VQTLSMPLRGAVTVDGAVKYSFVTWPAVQMDFATTSCNYLYCYLPGS
jgi:hypothetical protein